MKEYKAAGKITRISHKLLAVCEFDKKWPFAPCKWRVCFMMLFLKTH